MKPLLDQAFWSDPDIEQSPSEVKLAALWLITNPQTNLIGVCGASSGRFTFETGLNSEALERALKGLPRAFVRVGSVVFVKNYIRHQFGSGDKLKRNNFFVALKSLFLGIKDERLRMLFVTEYPEFKEALMEPLEGLTKPKDGKEGEDKDKIGKGSAEGKTKDNLPTSERSKRIAILFSRKLTTEWNDKEIAAFKKISKQPDEDFDLVEEFYKSDYEFLRHDLLTFLNNFTGEVDKARKWKAGKLNGSHRPNSPVNPRVAGTANQGMSSQYRGVGRVEGGSPSGQPAD